MSLKILNYVEMVAHLVESAVSAQELSQLTGIHIASTRKFLKELHKRKIVHIAQWDSRFNRRIKIPMYKLGVGNDAVRPRPLPNAVIQRRWKERQKARQQFDPFFAICRVAVSGEADQVQSVRATKRQSSVSSNS